MKKTFRLLDHTMPPEHYDFVEETRLWIPPSDCPAEVVEQFMPKEDAADSYVVCRIFFKERPEWWSKSYAMRGGDLRRRQVYALWKEVEYEGMGNGGADAGNSLEGHLMS